MGAIELLKELNITQRGTYSSDDTYVIDLKDSNEYGRINSKLDKNESLDYIEDSSFLTVENGNLDYQYGEEFIISLIADFDMDEYKLVIVELK